ncbi:MAG: DeoR/GlpR transcriptional regulator [Verrucomicrobia bacterium]|nr:DeoR/GlpR transcriptional regulator [Verrucomicrobiota bacterium]
MSSPKRLENRASLILDLVDRQGSATYVALAEVLQVSTMTVRRDCDELVRLGRVIKTVGGIQQASAAPYLYENSVRERIASNQSEKRAIAAKALELIRDNQTIFIDGGTTNLTLARLIAVQRTGLTILTNSALTCLELSKGNNTIIGIGGEYDPITLSFAGPQADEMAKSFLIDQAFLSTKGFLPEDGTFESAVATSRVKQVMAGRAAQTVLVVDHTKFGVRALSKVLDISQIHHVVTDQWVKKSDLAAVQRAGITAHVAAVTNLEVDYVALAH